MFPEQPIVIYHIPAAESVIDDGNDDNGTQKGTIKIMEILCKMSLKDIIFNT